MVAYRVSVASPRVAPGRGEMSPRWGSGMKNSVPVPGMVTSMTAVAVFMVAALVAYGGLMVGTSADRPAAAAPAPGAPGWPAPGNYTYAVDGEEGATGAGSRRYPEQMTT